MGRGGGTHGPEKGRRFGSLGSDGEIKRGARRCQVQKGKRPTQKSVGVTISNGVPEK